MRACAFSTAPCVRPVLRRDTRAAARRKKDKPHPELHEAPIIVNGNEVAKITGPLKEYHVDIWSGNHPFYNGDNRNLVLDEGQVNRFKSRYGALTDLSKVETLSDQQAAEAEDDDADVEVEEDPLIKKQQEKLAAEKAAAKAKKAKGRKK